MIKQVQILAHPTLCPNTCITATRYRKLKVQYYRIRNSSSLDHSHTLSILCKLESEQQQTPFLSCDFVSLFASHRNHTSKHSLHMIL